MAEANPLSAEAAPRWSDLRYPLLDLVPPQVVASAAKVCVFADGTNAIIVTKEDDVYVVGDNNYMVLGLVDYEPPRAMKNNALCGKGICQVVASISNTFVLANTRDGAVYSWGQSGHNALGNNCSGPGPSRLEFGENINITQVACGHNHAMAVDSNGQVFSWGSNNMCQLGDGSGQAHAVPVKAICDIKVSSVVCGVNNSMAIDLTGQLYVWGEDTFNLVQPSNQQYMSRKHRVMKQKILGQGNISGYMQGKKICQVSIGCSHILMLCADGTLMSSGTNNQGQLGYSEATNVPKLIDFPSATKCTVKEVAATPNGNTSAALLSNGKIYVWGECWKQNLSTPRETYCSSIQGALSSASKLQNSCGTIHLFSGKTNSLVEDNLAKAFQDKLTSDTVFIVDSKKIFAHMAILQIRCPHFYKKYTGDVTAVEKREIAVPEYSYDVYRAFIEYIYTEKITIPPEGAVNLLDLANTYNESHLKQLCVELIQRDVTASNVAAVYAAAIKFKAKNLEEFCASFAARNLGAVCQSEAFAKLDKPVLLSLLSKCQPLGGFTN